MPGGSTRAGSLRDAGLKQEGTGRNRYESGVKNRCSPTGFRERHPPVRPHRIGEGRGAVQKCSALLLQPFIIVSYYCCLYCLPHRFQKKQSKYRAVSRNKIKTGCYKNRSIVPARSVRIFGTRRLGAPDCRVAAHRSRQPTPVSITLTPRNSGP